MKRQDLSQLGTNDLREKIKEESAALAKMRFNHSISPVENPLKMRTNRKEIARMKTELRKRELAEVKKSGNGKK
ncbi:MAG TPA: 50S ribosomal protein L29 [Bacteroidia bacterium]|jgi:large subunit ribosomal protein L29